jgi:hypothetical protein
MITITLSSPKPRRQPRWQVIGSYDGLDDRYTFGFREFDDAGKAESYACLMMDMHNGDKLETD